MMSNHYKFQNLTAVTATSANRDQAALLDKAQQQVGFVPNMYRNMVNIPGLLDNYLHGYGTFRQESELTPVEQEVVFLAISKQNGCDYCTAAHSTLAANYSGVPGEILDAIRADTPLPDSKLAALYSLTIDVTNSRGRPSVTIVDHFLAAGYNEKQLLAIILAVSNKVLSNYINHLFDTPVDDMFAAYRVS